MYLKRENYPTISISKNGGAAVAIHWEQLPAETRIAILTRQFGIPQEPINQPAWIALVSKAARVRDDAQDCYGLMLELQRHLDNGIPAKRAYRQLAAAAGVSVPTIERMRAKLRNIPRADWLPALAKNYKGGGSPAAMSEEAWAFMVGLLRDASARYPLTAAYRETAEIAEQQVWDWPSYGTVRNRWLQVPAGEKALLKSGPKAFDGTLPTLDRTIAHIGAMGRVNLDGRMADLFVRWPDGTISRPIVIAIQDVFSRKILAWRVSKTEDADTTKAVILAVIDGYGLFDNLTTDNGRAFASKKISGGAPHRFRGKTGDDEISGILRLIGSDVQFAKPRNGRAKPIERSFRDVAEQIDTLPEFKGAYCGHRPDAKPEEFNGKPVALTVFQEVYQREIDRQNALPKRRTEMGKGKFSFDQVFDESFQQRPRRIVTAGQRRYFMYDMAWLKPNANTGALSSKGFRYWSIETQDILLRHSNRKVRVLFDPNDRSKPVIVEDRDGRVIVESLPCLERGQFDNSEHARQHERGKAQAKRAAQDGIKARKLMTSAQVAEYRQRAHAARPAPALPTVETNIVEPLFGLTGRTAVMTEADPREDAELHRANSIQRGLQKLKEERRAG